MNAEKTDYMCLNEEEHIYTLNGGSLKLVDKFIYLESSVSKNAINIFLAKALTAIDRLYINMAMTPTQ